MSRHSRWQGKLKGALRVPQQSTCRHRHQLSQGERQRRSWTVVLYSRWHGQAGRMGRRGEKTQPEQQTKRQRGKKTRQNKHLQIVQYCGGLPVSQAYIKVPDQRHNCKGFQSITPWKRTSVCYKSSGLQVYIEQTEVWLKSKDRLHRG